MAHGGNKWYPHHLWRFLLETLETIEVVATTHGQLSSEIVLTANTLHDINDDAVDSQCVRRHLLEIVDPLDVVAGRMLVVLRLCLVLPAAVLS